MHWCVLLMHVELLKMIYILLWTARCQYLIIFECDMLKFMLCANDWKGIDKDYFIFVFEIFSVKKWNTLKMIIGISSTYFEAKGMKSNQRTPTRTQEKKRNHIKVLRPASLYLSFFPLRVFGRFINCRCAIKGNQVYFVYYGLVLNCNKKLIESRP